MAKKKKVEEVKTTEEVKEKVTPVVKEPKVAPKAEVTEPAKKSKMYRARIVRKKLVRE